MRSPEINDEWDRPLHSEIGEAITALGEGAIEEIRESLHGGFEPFEAQMHRRMKTRLPEKRPAYKTLRDAGEKKVRTHLAAIDMEGLTPRRRRRKRKPIDRSRLKCRPGSAETAREPVAIS